MLEQAEQAGGKMHFPHCGFPWSAISLLGRTQGRLHFHEGGEAELSYLKFFWHRFNYLLE